MTLVSPLLPKVPNCPRHSMRGWHMHCHRLHVEFGVVCHVGQNAAMVSIICGCGIEFVIRPEGVVGGIIVGPGIKSAVVEVVADDKIEVTPSASISPIVGSV